MAIQVRIMGHKRRNHDDLTATLKKMGFEVREYIDTSDDYKLENNQRDRHKGASENLCKMITDFELPDDNKGFVVMMEDDVIPIPSLYQTLQEFFEQAPCDRCYSGFLMRSTAQPKQYNQSERVSPVGFLNTQFWLMPLELAKRFDVWRKDYPECQDGLLWWCCPRGWGRQVAPTDVMVNRFITSNGLRQFCVFPNFVEHKHVESLCDNKWLRKNGVPRSSVWYDAKFDFSKVNWANAVARYNKERYAKP